jgi:hypothetical protein
MATDTLAIAADDVVLGVAAGYLVLHWTIGTIMRRTTPDLGR